MAAVMGFLVIDCGIVRVERADTFLQCQSNCLASDWCATAVWIDRGSEG